MLLRGANSTLLGVSTSAIFFVVAVLTELAVSVSRIYVTCDVMEYCAWAWWHHANRHCSVINWCSGVFLMTLFSSWPGRATSVIHRCCKMTFVMNGKSADMIRRSDDVMTSLWHPHKHCCIVRAKSHFSEFTLLQIWALVKKWLTKSQNMYCLSPPPPPHLKNYYMTNYLRDVLRECGVTVYWCFALTDGCVSQNAARTHKPQNDITARSQ